MLNDARVITMDAKADATRWCLADCKVMRCRRCKRQMTVTISPADYDSWPIMHCQVCFDTAGKLVELREYHGPEPKCG